MVAAQIAYDFTSDLSPTSESPGWSSSAPITEVGAGTVEWRSTGALRNVTGTTSLSQTTIYMTLTWGPDDVLQPWTPGVLSGDVRRVHTSTSQQYRIRTSVDGFAADVATWTPLPTSFGTPKTVDLSSLGEITGPLEIRFYPTGGSTGAYLEWDSLVLNAVYTPAGAADQDVAPGGIQSAEAFGSAVVDAPLPQDLAPGGIASGESFGDPTFVVIQPVNLEPEAIVSGEAFGTPVVVVIPSQGVAPAGVGSGEAFGVPEVTYGAPVPVEPYPTAEDVSVFLTGSEVDERLVAMAEVHVGVVTHFARIYTRGNGFYVDGVVPEIAAVILAATARLASNPGQIDITIGSVRRQGSFKGWTLAEQKVLNPYRKVAL